MNQNQFADQVPNSLSIYGLYCSFPVQYKNWVARAQQSELRDTKYRKPSTVKTSTTSYHGSLPHPCLEAGKQVRRKGSLFMNLKYPTSFGSSSSPYCIVKSMWLITVSIDSGSVRSRGKNDTSGWSSICP